MFLLPVHVHVLQGGDEKYRMAWAQICEISRKEFQKVYERLGVHLEEKVLQLTLFST